MNIAVVRALPGLGDMLCAVPALRSLRAGLPDARVTLVGLASSQWFVDRFDRYVDDLLVLPSWPTIVEATEPPGATLDLLAGPLPDFDLAVQLQGCGGPVNALGRALGARVVVGHDPEPSTDDRRWMRRWPSAGHEIVRLQGLVRWIGCPATGTALEFPERGGDTDTVPAPAGGPLVVVHPGASVASRRWPAAGFAAVAGTLRASGCDVVLTGAPAERPLLHEVAATSGARVPGPMSLGALAALLRRATALVVNDTGVAHLAVATGTPSVVVGRPDGDHDRWAPLDRRMHELVVASGDLDADIVAVTGAATRAVRRGVSLLRAAGTTTETTHRSTSGAPR